MAIYKFRVTFEDFEDVYRDIEIQSDMGLADLHYAILSSISFDSIHKGVFYESDHSWRKGSELLSASPDGNKGAAVKETLSDIIYDPRQRFIYVYDEAEKWTFTVELIKILPDDSTLTTYRCINKVGNAPKQYKEAPMKFKSTDEPDGRKTRKKKETKKPDPVFDDEDDEPLPPAEDDDEDDDADDDGYEHEAEEFDEDESDLKDDVFTDDDDDDGDDDDDFGSGDDEDEFGGGFSGGDEDDF